MIPVLCAILLGREAAAQDPADLVRLLGSADVEVRDEAERRLIEKGKAAVPALLAALKDSDSEVSGRTRTVLRRLALRAWHAGDPTGTLPDVRAALGLPEKWTFEAPQIVNLGRGYNRVAFPPDLTLLARGSSDDGSVLLVDLRSGDERRRWAAHPTAGPGSRPSVRSLSFSSDGRLLATCGFDRTLAVWEAGKGTIVRRFDIPAEPVALSPDGTLLAAGDSKGDILLLEVSTGREVRRLKGHPRSLYLLSFAPDGRTLASASGFLGGRCDRPSDDVPLLRLWDVARGENVRTLDEAARAGRSGLTAAWSRDGKKLAIAGGISFSVRDGATGDLLYEKPVERTVFYGVAFSPGGGMLALPGFRGVSLRSAATGEEVGVCSVREPGSIHLRSASFSSDGKRLAAPDTLGETVRVWNLDE